MRRRRADRVPVRPGQVGDRFPDFDVLDQAPAWDRSTAAVVLDRLGPQPAIRFFTPHEAATARALLDQLLDQRAEPRVPVLELIDARLAAGQTDGWRYDDMPEDALAWQTTLSHVDSDAWHRHGKTFDECSWTEQAAIVSAVQERSGTDWHDLPATHVWSLWTRYACTAFYSHPWAWTEMGFSGPAYPRGYKNIGLDRREPWEVADRDAVDPVRQRT
jgi:hypothetical protein